ncbi:hypothetical protein DW036_12105 [Bacteroides sp. AF39-11AC]|nr:hypothetical protein DW036_12105 [Bacteroides sp. AF39-11AC]
MSIIYASAFKKNRGKIGRILSRFVLFDIQDFINSIFQACKKLTPYRQTLNFLWTGNLYVFYYFTSGLIFYIWIELAYLMMTILLYKLFAMLSCRNSFEQKKYKVSSIAK